MRIMFVVAFATLCVTPAQGQSVSPKLVPESVGRPQSIVAGELPSFDLATLSSPLARKSDSLAEMSFASDDAATDAPRGIVTLNVAPAEDSGMAPQPYRLSTFGKQAGKVGLELAAFAVVIASTRVDDVTKDGQSFRFKSEGWFGKSSYTLGMDKVHHAYKTYVIADILQSVIARKMGDRRGSAVTGALLGLGLMTYGEVFDGFSGGSGFSNQDSLMHVAGAGFSLLRNSVPGLREKVDFRMLIEPSFKGDHHQLSTQLAQRKYLLATQLSGFKGLERSPLRFVELHVGYFASGFADYQRLRGDPLKRRVYVGLGFNVQQLFSAKPQSAVERIAKGALDYIQLPYTSIH